MSNFKVAEHTGLELSMWEEEWNESMTPPKFGGEGS